MPSFLSARHLLTILVLTFAGGVCSHAAPGAPLAVRLWPNHGVTVETMWDLHLGLRINEANQASLPRAIDAQLAAGQPGLVLDRLPNQDHPTVTSILAKHKHSENAIKATRISLAQEAVLTLIEVDGVRIIDAGLSDPKSLATALPETLEARPALRSADVLLTPDTANAEQLEALAKLIQPRIAVLAPGTSLTTVGSAEVLKVAHNTVAVSALGAPTDETRWVLPTTTPWVMPAEFVEPFARKEASCDASQAVFAPLTANQMNFVPGNGTHTPRWNPEHMNSAERTFFSRLYHGVDPEIPVLNQRPAQNPDQYVAAHPEWTGAEEARGMQRTQAFTRRFAYLLADVPEPPADARGRRFRSPLSLLSIMENHYAEHTEHVKKKMALDNWPDE